MSLDRIGDHTAPNAVAVNVDGDNWDEGIADEAVTPGAVVEQGTSNEDVTEAGAGATEALGWASGNAQPSESEDTQVGLRDDYADGDHVVYYFNHGDRFMGIIEDSGGDDTITKGDLLKPAADGELALFVDGTDGPELAVAKYVGDDDVSNNGSNSRELVEWIA